MKSYITKVWEVTAEEADVDNGIVHSTTRRFSQEYDAREMVRVYEKCSIRELEEVTSSSKIRIDRHNENMIWLELGGER